MPDLKWACGVTTVPQRLDTLLPRTLRSLGDAGFPDPHLFIDGPANYAGATVRDPAVGAYGNWILGLLELYIRNPRADRYAVFQDDLMLCRNVRQYLDACPYPPRSYVNLFTFATNEQRIGGRERGWHRSDQMGKGALALVFDREAAVTLLQQPHILDKPTETARPHKNVDGAIQHALIFQARFAEYIHNPSLVQHTGQDCTTLGNQRHPLALTFPGETFNAMELLP